MKTKKTFKQQGIDLVLKQLNCIEKSLVKNPEIFNIIEIEHIMLTLEIIRTKILTIKHIGLPLEK